MVHPDPVSSCGICASDTQYLKSMLIGLTLDGTRPAVFCPGGGKLFVLGPGPLALPVVIDAGFVTLSGEGSATPYGRDRATLFGTRQPNWPTSLPPPW